MDPQQELFIRIKKDMERFGFDVYDGILPPEGTPYPFVYLGDSQTNDKPTKTQINGLVNQTIHVWTNSPKQRGTVSEMLSEIKRICRIIGETQNFSWSVRNVSQRIIPDNTTKTPLLHGVLEIEFYFS